MENEVMVTVLNEVLAEQKEIAGQVQSLLHNIKVLSSRMESFEKKLDNLKITALPADLQPTQLLIAKNMEVVKKVVAEQPKNVMLEKRYLFFPEHNAKEYYGTLLRWLLYIIIATYGFFLIKHMLDKWR
ncbi:MAG: hypothetical protein NVS3B8_11780 [Chitinophagaceae bacterium]